MRGEDHGSTTLFQLACKRQAGGDLDGAGEALEALIEVDPKNVQAWSNRGILLLLTGQSDRAATYLRQAAVLAPNEAPVLLNLGVALKSQGDLRAAANAFEQAITIESGLATAHLNLCSTLQALGQLQAAIEAGRRVTALAPDLALAHNSLGTALQRAGHYNEARERFEHAAELEPRWHLPWFNLGELALQLDDADDAIRKFRQCISLNPQYAEAHFDLSLALLQTGAFAEGWQEYEWRWGGPAPVPAVEVDAPLWNGEPLEGATILLTTEQGAGDNIQFIRFARALQRRGATVWLRAPAALAPVLATCDGVAMVIVQGDPLPGSINYQLPLMSIPRVLGESWKADLEAHAYLAPKAKAAPVLSDLRRPGRRSVGIVWSGNPEFVHNAERSCTAADFASLCDIPGLHIVSLQHGEKARDLARFADMGIIDVSGHMDDFAQTAAMIRHLDLVVSVDTSVPHLAAALGTPVWLLLHKRPDWRWMRGQDGTMWYPSMRLFRQTVAGDWSDVFMRIRSCLTRWAAAGDATPAAGRRNQ